MGNEGRERGGQKRKRKRRDMHILLQVFLSFLVVICPHDLSGETSPSHPVYEQSQRAQQD